MPVERSVYANQEVGESRLKDQREQAEGSVKAGPSY